MLRFDLLVYKNEFPDKRIVISSKPKVLELAMRYECLYLWGSDTNNTAFISHYSACNTVFLKGLQ